MPRPGRAVLATAAALVLALAAPATAQAAPKAIDGNSKVLKLTLLAKGTFDEYALAQKIDSKLGKAGDVWITRSERDGNKVRITLVPTPWSHKPAVIRAATPHARRVLALYGKVTAAQFYELDMTVKIAKGSSFARDELLANIKLAHMAPHNQCSATSSLDGTDAEMVCEARVTVTQYHAIARTLAALVGQPVSKIKVTTY